MDSSTPASIEMLLNTIEVVSSLVPRSPKVPRRSSRTALISSTPWHPTCIDLATAGTLRPRADSQVTDSDRYAQLVERTHWGHQMLLYGVHVTSVSRTAQILPIQAALTATSGLPPATNELLPLLGGRGHRRLQPERWSSSNCPRRVSPSVRRGRTQAPPRTWSAPRRHRGVSTVRWDIPPLARV